MTLAVVGVRMLEKAVNVWLHGICSVKKKKEKSRALLHNDAWYFNHGYIKRRI